jgi:Flp pilus assembly protein TadG
MEPVMRRLLTLLRRFRSDRRGNIAILFGLAVVPIFGIMGAALDYSMANQQRTTIQAALDNTALSLSKMMPLSDADLNSYGWKIFNANLGSSPLQYTQPNLTITQSSNGKLILQIDTSYPMKMASVMTKFFGMSPNMAVNAHSETQWGNTRLRVALVLDNSGSMASAGKMTALKKATKNLITTLSAVAKNPEDVYISIIPFSKSVNVGASNYTKDWIYWDNATKDDLKSWDALNGSCTISGNNNRSDCINDTKKVRVCSKPQYTNKNDCEDNNGSWDRVTVNGVWTPDNHNTWNGCIMDRGLISTAANSGGPGTNAGNDQKNVSTLTSDLTTLYPAEQYAYCNYEMQGLTNSWSTLNTLVDNMQPNGSTNQPIGLVWGWQSLGGGGPLTAPTMDTANYAYNQIIILLSDGLNTQNHWNGNGSDVSTQVDQRMYYKNGSTVTGTCQNIKDVTVNPITIYTVQVNTGGDAQSAVLKACASDASKFFELKSADAIVTTFDQIGSALANIHLSK